MSGSGGRVLVFTRGPDSEAIVTDSMITISSTVNSSTSIRSEYPSQHHFTFVVHVISM
jgi:hypothetical protein